MPLPGVGGGRRPPRCVLEQQASHRVRGTQAPGGHLLHELPPAGPLLHQPAQNGKPDDDDGGGDGGGGGGAIIINQCCVRYLWVYVSFLPENP